MTFLFSQHFSVYSPLSIHMKYRSFYWIMAGTMYGKTSTCRWSWNRSLLIINLPIKYHLQQFSVSSSFLVALHVCWIFFTRNLYPSWSLIVNPIKACWLIDWLIDYTVFYVVSAMFRLYNGGPMHVKGDLIMGGGGSDVSQLVWQINVPPCSKEVLVYIF